MLMAMRVLEDTLLGLVDLTLLGVVLGQVVDGDLLDVDGTTDVDRELYGLLASM